MICHNDTITLIQVTSTGYGNTKRQESRAEIMATFQQNTGFLHSANGDQVDADAVLYPDEKNQFVIDNANRLEGMYVIANPYGGNESEAWYKITSVAVNRDHLLSNTIDNIQCLLKKTRPIAQVS